MKLNPVESSLTGHHGNLTIDTRNTDNVLVCVDTEELIIEITEGINPVPLNLEEPDSIGQPPDVLYISGGIRCEY